MNAWRRSILVMAALLAVTGCARAARSTSTGNASIDRNFCPKSTATLYVTNDGWLDIVIYVYRGGTRYRLGDVTAVQSAVFQIPEAMMGAGSDIALFADPVGSSYGYNTGSIPLSPGHTAIDLRIANIINQSTFSYGVEAPEIS